MLATYLTELHNSGKSPATLSQVSSGIAFVCKASKTESPIGNYTRLALKAAKRDGGGRGRGQVDGLTWDSVNTVSAIASRDESDKLRSLRDRTLIAIMSDTAIRVSELVALNVEDISLNSENGGSGLVHVKKSKTDQMGKGRYLYIGKPTLDLANEWKAAASIESDSLFRGILRGGKAVGSTRLTVRSVRRIIQARAKAAGIDGRFSGHSLRVGTAISLVTKGASVAEVCSVGRWKSAGMVLHYSQKATEADSPIKHYLIQGLADMTYGQYCSV